MQLINMIMIAKYEIHHVELTLSSGSREEESKQKKVPAQKPRLTQAEGTKKRKKKRLQKKLDRLRVRHRSSLMFIRIYTPLKAS